MRKIILVKNHSRQAELAAQPDTMGLTCKLTLPKRMEVLRWFQNTKTARIVMFESMLQATDFGPGPFEFEFDGPAEAWSKRTREAATYKVQQGNRPREKAYV